MASRGNQGSGARGASRSAIDRTRDFLSQIERERHGVPAAEAEALRRAMALSIDRYAPLLGMKPSAYKRHRVRRAPIKGAPGYAISDLEDMIHKVDELVSSDVGDFNSSRWFSGWVEKPQPALGGLMPASLLDTPTGRQMVSRVLGAMGSGAYL